MAPLAGVSGPVFALTIAVYCLNMFGDAMRDLLDPQAAGAARGQGGSGGHPPEADPYNSTCDSFEWRN